MATNRRQDLDTARHVREAITMQRSIGFEPALMLLQARGVPTDAARALLGPYHDRRVKERRNLATRQQNGK